MGERNIEIDPYKLVELGLVTLSEDEYISDVSGHQIHSEGSGISFWVGVRLKPDRDGLSKVS